MYAIVYGLIYTLVDILGRLSEFIESLLLLDVAVAAPVASLYSDLPSSPTLSGGKFSTSTIALLRVFSFMYWKSEIIKNINEQPIGGMNTHMNRTTESVCFMDLKC